MSKKPILDSDKIDWNLLKEQKQNLVNAAYDSKPVDAATIEGLIHFLDYVLDEAEEQKCFIDEEKEND